MALLWPYNAIIMAIYTAILYRHIIAIIWPYNREATQDPRGGPLLNRTALPPLNRTKLFGFLVLLYFLQHFFTEAEGVFRGFFKKIFLQRWTSIKPNKKGACNGRPRCYNRGIPQAKQGGHQIKYSRWYRGRPQIAQGITGGHSIIILKLNRHEALSIIYTPLRISGLNGN